jgi:SAM-dependent methyltransferase
LSVSDPPDVREAGSIAFDRAAAFYDRTRRMTAEARAATTAMMLRELTGRGRVLEVGVGTGQISLPLHAAGIPMAGIDVSRPMLDVLVHKAGGRPPFPVVHGDATALPFSDGVFGGAVVRHVLHLVPAYGRLVDELVRAVRPGGVVVASAGWLSPISDELDALLSQPGRRRSAAGLDARDVPAQDRAFEARGAVAREVPSIRARDADTVAEYADAIEASVYSWTWPLTQRERERAAARIRLWARTRRLEPSAPIDPEVEFRWRAYDMPG